MPAPALQAAGAVVAGRDHLPRLLAGLGAALAGLLMLVMAPLALVSSGAGTAPAPVPGGIPAAFVPVYREAARVFGVDWLVLASVHAQTAVRGELRAAVVVAGVRRLRPFLAETRAAVEERRRVRDKIEREAKVEIEATAYIDS